MDPVSLLETGKIHSGDVQFPIFDNATDYAAGKMRQIEGMSQRSIDAIDATKPYKGGTDLLWVLHKLDILDKHRTILTVRQRVPSGVIMAARSKFPELGIRVFASAKPIDELHIGQELLRESLDTEENEGMLFAFGLALNEVGVIQGRLLTETLQEIIYTVNGIITEFEKLLP